jgi:hypothetical protein
MWCSQYLGMIDEQCHGGVCWEHSALLPLHHRQKTSMQDRRILHCSHIYSSEQNSMVTSCTSCDRQEINRRQCN